MSDPDNHVIRASEVGQYVFCTRSWWLGAVEGLPSTNLQEMAAGEAEHQWHGQAVRASIGLNRLATVVLLLALIVGIVWAVGWVLG